MSRRRFGRVRRLPSGRYQARYPAPDGSDRPAPVTFATKTEAARWLSLAEAEILKGRWVDPQRGDVPFGEYARRWVAERNLRPRTVELYEGLLRLHLLPTFERVPVNAVTADRVRAWRRELLESGRSVTTTAKAYRLLKAVMTTAVDDELLGRHPCRIKGAGSEPTPERPVATVRQVFALAEQMPPCFRALVLIATFTGLRWGELSALRRRDLDLAGRRVHVVGSVSEMRDGRRITGPPKSAAGVRRVSIPGFLVPVLVEHLTEFSEPGPDGLIFVGPKGGPLRRNNFGSTTGWKQAVAAVGVADLHFHDLRHTGNTLAAPMASTRELMARLGHSSARAALIYQHATDERDMLIAEDLDQLVRRELGQCEMRAPGEGRAAGT